MNTLFFARLAVWSVQYFGPEWNSVQRFMVRREWNPVNLVVIPWLFIAQTLSFTSWQSTSKAYDWIPLSLSCTQYHRHARVSPLSMLNVFHISEESLFFYFSLFILSKPNMDSHKFQWVHLVSVSTLFIAMLAAWYWSRVKHFNDVDIWCPRIFM